MGMYPVRRECSECGRLYSVNQDGTVRRHFAKGNLTKECWGTGQLPTPVKIKPKEITREQFVKIINDVQSEVNSLAEALVNTVNEFRDWAAADGMGVTGMVGHHELVCNKTGEKRKYIVEVKEETP